MGAAYQFFRPLAFLTVKGPSLHIYRTTLPILASLAVVILFAIAPREIDLVGDKSTSDYLQGFFVTLPGFFIAALAAVASFNGRDLDKELPNVTVEMTVYGDTAENPITLRVFLCYLFAYLTTLSFVGFFICVGGALLSPSITTWIGALCNPEWVAWALFGSKMLFLGLMAFLAASVVFFAPFKAFISSASEFIRICFRER